METGSTIEPEPHDVLELSFGDIIFVLGWTVDTIIEGLSSFVLLCFHFTVIN